MKAQMPAPAIGGGSTNNSTLFSALASKTAQFAGRPAAFLIATGIVIIWAVSGPFFGYSDTWQLVINTGTTIITFLMVFLIQNTQSRDTLALQLKLDELILATKNAENRFATIEDASDEELDALKKELHRRAKESGSPSVSPEND